MRKLLLVTSQAKLNGFPILQMTAATTVVTSGIGMHLAFYASLWVHAFTAQMLLCYLAFIPASTTHAFTERVLGRVRSGLKRESDGGEG